MCPFNCPHPHQIHHTVLSLHDSEINAISSGELSRLHWQRQRQPRPGAGRAQADSHADRAGGQADSQADSSDTQAYRSASRTDKHIV